jgi:hypothetical protein
MLVVATFDTDSVLGVLTCVREAEGECDNTAEWTASVVFPIIQWDYSFSISTDVY